MNRVYLTCLFVTMLLSVFGQPKTHTVLNFPETIVLPFKFEKAVKEQSNEFNRLFYKDSSLVKNYTTPFMLDKIDHDSNYDYIFLAEYWIAFHYKEVIPQLIERITDKKEVGLVNTADLIIWERIKSGQLKFYGEGEFQMTTCLPLQEEQIGF